MICMTSQNYGDVRTIAPLQIKSKPCYRYSAIALLHMKIWTVEEEARRLSKRFEGVKNRAAFARDHKVPGGQSMIYQHITARRPIGIEAALAYAQGFRCTVDEISPRLAIDARKALSLENGETAFSEREVHKESGLLTKEQEFAISLVGRMDGETKIAFMALFEKLVPDRRKENIDPHPMRRLGSDIPPDPHDTRLYDHDLMGEIKQSKEIKRK